MNLLSKYVVIKILLLVEPEDKLAINLTCKKWNQFCSEFVNEKLFEKLCDRIRFKYKITNYVDVPENVPADLKFRIKHLKTSKDYVGYGACVGENYYFEGYINSGVPGGDGILYGKERIIGNFEKNYGFGKISNGSVEWFGNFKNLRRVAGGNEIAKIGDSKIVVMGGANSFVQISASMYKLLYRTTDDDCVYGTFHWLKNITYVGWRKNGEIFGKGLFISENLVVNSFIKDKKFAGWQQVTCKKTLVTVKLFVANNKMNRIIGLLRGHNEIYGELMESEKKFMFYYNNECVGSAPIKNKNFKEKYVIYYDCNNYLMSMVEKIIVMFKSEFNGL